MRQPLIEYGGSGTPIHLAPANSFPPDTYLPVIQPLTARHRVLCFPPRPLWPGIGAPPPATGSWVEVGEDIVAGVLAHDLQEVIAIGHSFGAVGSLVAVARRPDRFRGLCLLDPTMVLPEDISRVYRTDEHGKKIHRLAEKSRQRRNEFPTHAEAFAYWRPKPLFSDWNDEALWQYVRAALRDSEDGCGFVLAWSPAWETYYYEAFYHECWEELERLDQAIPVLVVRGEASHAFIPAAEARLQAIRPTARCVVVPGQGHLFPQTAPELLQPILADWIAHLK